MDIEITPELGKQLLNTLKEANIKVAQEYHDDPEKLHYLENAHGNLREHAAQEMYNKFTPYFANTTPPEAKEAFLTVLHEFLHKHEPLLISIVTFTDHLITSMASKLYIHLTKIGAYHTLLRSHDKETTHPAIMQLILLLNHKEEYEKLLADYNTIMGFINKLQQDTATLGATITLQTYKSTHNLHLINN